MDDPHLLEFVGEAIRPAEPMIYSCLLRSIILRHRYSNKIAFWSVPILVLKTFFIDAFFVLYKGAHPECIMGSKESFLHHLSLWKFLSFS